MDRHWEAWGGQCRDPEGSSAKNYLPVTVRVGMEVEVAHDMGALQPSFADSFWFPWFGDDEA